MSNPTKTKRVRAWVYQRLNFDNWAISNLDGVIISRKGTIKNWFSKKGVELMGYKVGKKLKEQKYSDMTAYELIPLTLPTPKGRKKI